MAFTVTSAGRRLAMAVLLVLAIAGAVIRASAPDPSTLRDFGTLLLVLWLPAVGNLVAYFVRKIPRRAPQRAAGFGVGSAFMPHLRVQLEPAGMVRDLPATLAAAGNSCTLIVANSGFTARLGGPVPVQEDRGVQVELLRPDVALAQLAMGTEFRLAVGATAVAKGRVVEVVRAR